MGAICTNRDPSMWPEGCQAVPGDDVVHVMPKLLEPKAEVRSSKTAQKQQDSAGVAKHHPPPQTRTAEPSGSASALSLHGPRRCSC